ncbi:hypothetical protein DB346_23780 [Verrucomicrobia bacterium LW23]|nr:hypothetical protein DB346_23780 [Verrucomicrobia bacterium LW23]
MNRYYYVNQQHQTAGPVPYNELVSLHQQGQITSDTPVMPEGGSAWVPYRNYPFPESSTAGYGAAPAAASGGVGCGTWAAIILGGGCFIMIVLSIVGVLVLQQLGSEVEKEFGKIRSKLQETQNVLVKAQEGINASATAQRLLGSDIEVDEISGSPLEHRERLNMTSGTVSVKGSKGSGTAKIHYMLMPNDKTTGTWMVFELDVNGEKHDIRSEVQSASP